MIETGEITPFDVVNFKNDSGKQHLLGHDATINQTRKIDNLKNKPTNITGLSLIDRIKTSTQEVTTGEIKYYCIFLFPLLSIKLVYFSDEKPD